MKNFISNIKKYAVIIADVAFIVGALISAVNSFITAVDEHYPTKDEK